MITRNGGSVVDVAAGTVQGRSGLVYPARTLVMGAQGLYYDVDWHDHPRVAARETWLLPAQGWAISRFTLRDGATPLGYDWYIDLDRIAIDDARWAVSDCFLDVVIHEGTGYQVWDADELAEAMEHGVIPMEETLRTLRALDGLCRVLPEVGYSIPALIQRYAADLPIPTIPARGRAR